MAADNTIAVQLEQTLDALREREQDFNSLLENAQDFVIYRVAIDPEHPYGGRVVLVSPSIKDILGITDPYHFESWFERLHPDDAPMVIAANRRSWQEGVPYNQATRVYHPVKQTWLWVHTMSRPVFDAQGRLTHFNGLILDITEQKQAEVALEEARRTLEERVVERTREIERRREVAESLRGILKLLNSDSPTGEVLRYIVTEASRLLGSAASAIHQVDYAQAFVSIGAAHGFPPELSDIDGFPLLTSRVDQIILERRPFWDTMPAEAVERHLERLANDTALDPRVRRWRIVTMQRYRTFLAVPLVIRDQVYGSLTFYYAEPLEVDEEQITLAQTFADQVALAIENARLRAQVEQTAVAAERNRIARELHDSVSQALYGIALGTRTARALVDRQPVDGKVKTALANPLDYVLSLAESGLAEMRALIFELRPDALEKEGLVAALTRQAEAVRARHKLDVRTDFCAEPPALPLAAKEALYRVAQEALNNLVKHAQASLVNLRLYCASDALTLEVQDNGVGFDPQADYPGHLGLHTMRERVARFGGALEIESAPGAGATVRVKVGMP